MVDEMFRDVEQAMRDDKLKSFWQKWRFAIIGLVLAVVLAVVGNEYYKTNTQEVNQARLEAWQVILQLPAGDERQEKIDGYIAQKEDSHSMVARFYQARQKLSKDEKDEALTYFNQIVASAEPIYAGLARIEAAIIYLGDENYVEAGQILEPILAKDAPFRGLALYYAALSALYQENYATAAALAKTAIKLPSQTQALQDLVEPIFNRASLLQGQQSEQKAEQAPAAEETETSTDTEQK